MPKRTIDDVYDIADELAEEAIPYYSTAKTIYSAAKKVKKLVERPLINTPANQNPPIMPNVKRSKMQFTRRPYYKRTYRPKSVSGRLRKYAKSQARGQEVKRVDIVTSGSALQNLTCPLDSVGSTYTLNYLSIGPSDFQRIGNKVTGVAVHLDGYIFNNEANIATQSEDIVRFVIVYDKSPNGVLPTWSLIYQSTDATNFTQSNMVSQRNDKYVDRFIVLRDEFRYLPAANISGTTSGLQTMSSPDKMVNWYIPLKGLQTEYLANALTPADIGQGGIYLFIKSNTAPNNAAYNFRGTTRYLFTDS